MTSGDRDKLSTSGRSAPPGFVGPAAAAGNQYRSRLLLIPTEPLEPETVRVRWLATEPDERNHIARWRDMLDGEELAQADRFRFAQDRITFIAAHALRRAMLSDATGLPTDAWRYVTGPHGKR